jgi:hypothetical protein
LVTPIVVEVKAPTITHQLTLQQIQHWLESGCNSPKDKVTKDRLRKRLTVLHDAAKHGFAPRTGRSD